MAASSACNSLCGALVPGATAAALPPSSSSSSEYHGVVKVVAVPIFSVVRKTTASSLLPGRCVLVRAAAKENNIEKELLAEEADMSKTSSSSITSISSTSTDVDDPQTSFFTSITNALDFAETRSEKDAELLNDARRATKSGDQMSREQYAALRRKIGGTYRDFFKDSVDVVGEYVEEGWVDKTCRYCKKDTAGGPRIKDSLGRYAHVACAENPPAGNFFTRLFGR